jgi:hypothetical protein
VARYRRIRARPHRPLAVASFIVGLVLLVEAISADRGAGAFVAVVAIVGAVVAWYMPLAVGCIPPTNRPCNGRASGGAKRASSPSFARSLAAFLPPDPDA